MSNILHVVILDFHLQSNIASSYHLHGQLIKVFKGLYQLSMQMMILLLQLIRHYRYNFCDPKGWCFQYCSSHHTQRWSLWSSIHFHMVGYIYQLYVDHLVTMYGPKVNICISVLQWFNNRLSLLEEVNKCLHSLSSQQAM